MLIQQIDGGAIERRLVIALITDKSVLARISAKWDRELFASRWANRVGHWCVHFYGKHKDAPNKHILTMYQAWSEKHRDKAEIQLVSDFLSSISEEYEANGQTHNSDYMIDVAEKHFKRVKLEKHRDEISIHLENGDIDKAQALIDNFKPLQISASAGIDLLRDKEALMKAFEDKKEPLISFNGPLEPLNRFFQGSLERDALVGIMAAEKRGKSFMLMELAWRAMLQRRKVAFFACGDMSQSQMERRWAVRAAKHPLISRDGWPCRVQWPIDLKVSNNHADVTHEQIKFDKPLDWQLGWEGYQKAVERTKSNDTYLKLSCHPSRSISVKGIEAMLELWDREDWSPDVVCIDYADILGQTTKDISPVQKVDEDWALLSGLRQSRHCLVITATQVNAASYSASTLKRQHFASGHAKYGHCTGMFAINAEDEERVKGVTRLNWIQLRDGFFSENQCAYVAGCLAVANPLVRAIFE